MSYDYDDPPMHAHNTISTSAVHPRMKRVAAQPGTLCKCGHPKVEHTAGTRSCRHVHVASFSYGLVIDDHCDCTRFERK
jgi:hypothetical protein